MDFDFNVKQSPNSVVVGRSYYHVMKQFEHGDVKKAVSSLCKNVRQKSKPRNSGGRKFIHCWVL